MFIGYEDNFIYGKPANYEISAWGYNAWEYGEWQATELDRNPVKYLGVPPVERCFVYWRKDN